MPELLRRTPSRMQFGLPRPKGGWPPYLIRVFYVGLDGFTGGLSAKIYMSITDATSALERTGDRKSTRYWLDILSTK
ncbi:MAG: hypothetical protein COB08_010720 [Rhodobacteraceae bacterium]|nr:hypothetical protein [Paracoccaceae bacterium]